MQLSGVKVVQTKTFYTRQAGCLGGIKSGFRGYVLHIHFKIETGGQFCKITNVVKETKGKIPDTSLVISTDRRQAPKGDSTEFSADQRGNVEVITTWTVG